MGEHNLDCFHSILKSPFLEMLCSSSLPVPKPLSAQVLENTLVLRKILNYLPARDLDSASRVNRLWCTESRSIFRDHRRCLLLIHCFDDAHEDVLQAAKLLRGNNQPLPFNGFSFDFDPVKRKHIPCVQGIEYFDDINYFDLVMEKKGKILQLLMSSFKVKYVKVQIRDYVIRHELLAIRFVCDLIEKHAADIEELDFERCPYWLAKRYTVHVPSPMCYGWDSSDDEDVSDDEEPTIFFPSLRNLKMSPTSSQAAFGRRRMISCPCSYRYNRIVVRNIVQASPNLVCISRPWDVADMLLLPVPKWSLIQILEVRHKNGYIEDVWNSLRVKVPTSSMSNLTRLSLHSSVADILLTLENCATILQPIINASQQSLRYIKIPYCLLKTLDEVTMVNVDCVDIEMHEAPRFTPIVLPLFRWMKYFPNMRALSISISDESVDMCTCHQAYADTAERSSTLKNLSIDTGRLLVAEAAFPDFASCFPELITMSWTAGLASSGPQYLPHMWHYWSKLQSLTLDWKLQTVYMDLDSLAEASTLWSLAFAGIPYEEAKALSGESNEFLGQVMLVPSTYSMLHLKDLKIFSTDLNVANGALIESKLSRALVFSRMEGLTLSHY